VLDDWEENTGEHTLVASRADLAKALETKPKARPYLLVAAARQSVGRMLPLTGTTVLGRGQVDLSLDEEGLSRRHARFSIDASGDVIVEDLGSTNGTFVNGERISGPRVLRDGDRVEVGTATILKLAFQDELQEAIQRRLYEQATRDPLTGALNKRAFGESFAKEIAFAARHKRPLALLIIDGDHFKSVNDTFGHVAGDYVLRTLAQLVLGVLRREDVLARWGGEEFGVLLRDLAVEPACVCAERVRAAVERHGFAHEGRSIPFTISVGVVSRVPTATTSASELFEAADASLYAAKTAGRNRVVAL
jgi:two-component system cell cycle response regulator